MVARKEAASKQTGGQQVDALTTRMSWFLSELWDGETRRKVDLVKVVKQPESGPLSKTSASHPKFPMHCQ